MLVPKIKAKTKVRHLFYKQISASYFVSVNTADFPCSTPVFALRRLVMEDLKPEIVLTDEASRKMVLNFGPEIN